MYLSRIKLDSKNKNTQIALVSPSKFHGAIEDSFPRVEDRSKGNRKLWRIDRYDGNIFLLLLSKEKPNFSGFVKQFCKNPDDVEMKSYDVLFDKVQQESVWRFRLVANPTKSIKMGDGKRGKIVAHITQAHQMEWLVKQAEKNGFDILPDETSVIASGWKIFKKRDKKEVRLMEVAYEGVLVVRDTELFINALQFGIGREKAYGMGLLTVVKVI